MRVVVRQGYSAATMHQIAQEARASKETLYAWFGDRESLMAVLIRANADESVMVLADATSRPIRDAADACETLESYARSLLALLTGEVSITLNRAAMSSPALAAHLLASGWNRAGSAAVEYLTALYEAGHSPHADAAQAFSLFYGLVVQDTHIRVLLGEPAPSAQDIRQRAWCATRVFLGVEADSAGSEAG
ncbi:MAG: TetR family transcriptional regulator [Micrococcales bacterium]|nr:MAG: TetR family transcriptional regulator [Micrococcales bacterium]